MGTTTSTGAPERARWPRLATMPHPLLRSLVPRGYAGFTEATTPRHLVLPATSSVPMVIKLVDSPRRPPAFVMGARGAYTVVDGDCAPSDLELWLDRWPPSGCWGCPWPRRWRDGERQVNFVQDRAAAPS